VESVADVSTREGVDSVIKAVIDRLGGVDIVINNVGGAERGCGGAFR
jgi:NAD(P)-dependent dehydrogenase (short-subunit alcohol dehydrogenase family)